MLRWLASLGCRLDAALGGEGHSWIQYERKWRGHGRQPRRRCRRCGHAEVDESVLAKWRREFFGRKAG